MTVVRRTRPRRDSVQLWEGRPIHEVVLQRRRQMLVHSLLYYKMDKPIVSDGQWQAWADELTKLQEKHGHIFGFYDNEFRDWDGSTGYHLPQHGWMYDKARSLLQYQDDQRKAVEANTRVRKAPQEPTSHIERIRRTR